MKHCLSCFIYYINCDRVIAMRMKGWSCLLLKFSNKCGWYALGCQNAIYALINFIYCNLFYFSLSDFDLFCLVSWMCFFLNKILEGCFSLRLWLESVHYLWVRWLVNIKIGNENSRVKANFPFFSSIPAGRRFFTPFFYRTNGYHCSAFVRTNACTLLSWVNSRGKHSIQDKNVGLRVCMYQWYAPCHWHCAVLSV